MHLGKRSVQLDNCYFAYHRRRHICVSRIGVGQRNLNFFSISGQREAVELECENVYPCKTTWKLYPTYEAARQQTRSFCKQGMPQTPAHCCSQAHTTVPKTPYTPPHHHTTPHHTTPLQTRPPSPTHHTTLPRHVKMAAAVTCSHRYRRIRERKCRHKPLNRSQWGE